MKIKEMIKELDKLMGEGGDVGKLMDAIGLSDEPEVESEVEDVKKKHQPLDWDDDTVVAESGGSIDDEWDD